MGILQEFYQAIPNEHKRCFLHTLHAALEHPVFEMAHIQSMMMTMADSTDMKEDICENAIKATVHLAGYPMSDLYSYLEDAGLVVPPPVLQIGVANAQLRNAEEGSSEGGSSFSQDTTPSNSTDEEQASSSGASRETVNTKYIHEQLAESCRFVGPAAVDTGNNDNETE